MKFFDVNQRFAQIWLSKILSLKMSFSGVNKSSTNFFISVKSLQKKLISQKKKCEIFFATGKSLHWSFHGKKIIREIDFKMSFSAVV